MTKLPETEHQTQQRIKDALLLAGFGVWHTSAFKQKGPSGVTKGIPDLLVWHDLIPNTFLGIEVKKRGRIKWSSDEQESAFKCGRFALAQSEPEAVRTALLWLEDLAIGYARIRATEMTKALQRAERTLGSLK